MLSEPTHPTEEDQTNNTKEERVPLYRVKALYDYSPQEIDELPLRRNQLLEVLSLEEDPWWTCRNENGSIGVAPNNYLQKLYDRNSPSTSPKSELTVQSSPPLDIDTSSEAKKINKGKKHANIHHKSNNSSRVFGAIKDTDLSALTLLRKQADIRINALKNAVEKMEMDSLSSTSQSHSVVETSSSPSVMSITSNHDNADNATSLIETADDAGRGVSVGTEITNVNDYGNSTLLIDSENDQSDEYDIASLYQIKPQHEQEDKNLPAVSEVKITNLAPRQISMVAASSSSAIRPSCTHSIRDGQNKTKKHHVHTKQVSKLPSIHSNKRHNIRHQHQHHERPQTSPRVTNYEFGFKYNPCRSIVYYPSGTSPDLISTEAPSCSLVLDHVYAYDGGAGVSGRGKNVMLLLDDRIIYPAASVIVALDTVSNRQTYFRGHKGDISAICVHAESNVAASAEQGKLCRILIWSLDLIGSPGSNRKDDSLNSSADVNDENISEIELDSSIRQISGINFSLDCKFFVCLAIGDHNTLLIYEIETLTLIASSRLGHSDVAQMGFNCYLYTPSVHYEDTQYGGGSSSRSTSVSHAHQREESKEQMIESCYTLVSCGGKQVKFWTLREVSERKDGSVMNDDEDGGFKGRKLAVPRRKQIWEKKFILEGTPCSNMDSPDIMCFTLTNDGRKGPFTQSRMFTGTSSGSVYIWKHLEDHSMEGVALWQPKGILLSIVTNVHDAPIVDIDYSGPSLYRGENGEEEDDDSWIERIVTVCQHGIVNTWNVTRVSSQDNQSSPFKQELCISVTGIQNIGAPRCIGFNIDCSGIIIGTTCNSICMLSGLPTDAFTAIDADKIALSRLVSGHTGKVKKVAVHPFEPIIATVSGDKTLRVWNYASRRQISACRKVGNPTCVAFSYDGKALACGNEAGELLILAPSSASPVHTTTMATEESDLNSWNIIFKRSIGPKAHAPSLNNAVMTGRPLYKKMKNSGAANNDNRSKKSPRISSALQVSKYSELTCLAYSPDGQNLAVGCRDKLVHVLSVHEGYKRIAVCKGHYSSIQNIDFSVDGLLMQSNDVSREVLHWDVYGGKQVTHTSEYIDVEWHTWTCVYGWPCQGIHNGQSGVLEDGDINAVARSKNRSLMVCGGSNTIDSSVKLFRFPTLPNSLPNVYGGHTSPVLDVAFGGKYDPEESDVVGTDVLFTVGGNDMCIFQWRIEGDNF